MWPLIEVAVETNSELDRGRLSVALAEMAAEDSSFAFHLDTESGLMIMGGVSEPHLEDKAGRLVQGHNIDMNFGAPEVAYRETIGRKAEIDYVHKKMLGPMGRQFAAVKIAFEPAAPGMGYVFENRIVEGSLPLAFVAGVENGLLQAQDRGLLAGFPMIDFRAALVDGKHHDVDSSVVAFDIAARAAFRQLREKASPKLLEPIMTVEVTTPEGCVGHVISVLNSRRGLIQSAVGGGDALVIVAEAPLAKMLGYANALRSLSQGRARFVIRYERYEEAPWPEPPDDLFPWAIGMRA